MSDRNQRIPPPPVLSEGTTNIDVLKPLVAEFNKVVRWIREIGNISPDLARRIEPQIMRLTKDLGIQCENESSGSSDWHPADAIIQFFNGTDFGDTDPVVAKDNVHDIYSLPYDQSDIVATIYHRQSGKNIPINLRTIRHAQTVYTEGGQYPDSANQDSVLVYPFKFTRISFVEAAGYVADLAPEYLCPTGGPDGYVANLMCGTWLPPLTDIWLYNVTGQWFTFMEAYDCFSGVS